MWMTQQSHSKPPINGGAIAYSEHSSTPSGINGPEVGAEAT